VPAVASRAARVPGVIRQKEEGETEVVSSTATALPLPWALPSTRTASGLVCLSEEETERTRQCSRVDSLGALEL
jgi:hypothetical protein